MGDPFPSDLYASTSGQTPVADGTMASRRSLRLDRGPQMYLWHAVDDEGEVLDVLLQARRDKNAALRLMHKLVKNRGLVPTSIITDRYRAYDAALRDLGLCVIHRRGKRLNNRAESSHISIRRREREMQGFRSDGSAQRFLSSHSAPATTLSTSAVI